MVLNTIPSRTGWPSQGTGDTECANHRWVHTAELVPVLWRICTARHDELKIILTQQWNIAVRSHLK